VTGAARGEGLNIPRLLQAVDIGMECSEFVDCRRKLIWYKNTERLGF
jgi:hypothetical protein